MKGIVGARDGMPKTAIATTWALAEMRNASSTTGVCNSELGFVFRAGFETTGTGKRTAEPPESL